MEHKTPTEKVFNEIKECAKHIWESNYSNEFNYVSEKLDIINALGNYSDNVMVCYRMFDMNNQAKLKDILSTDALEYINNNK